MKLTDTFGSVFWYLMSSLTTGLLLTRKGIAGYSDPLTFRGKK